MKLATGVFVCAGAVGAAVCSSVGVRAQTNITQRVKNGSFEERATSSENLSITMKPPAAIPGWTLLEGSLDLFGPATAAADGSRSLDLSGASKGKIRQSVPSNAGFDYELTFAMSGDPAGGPKERTLTTTAGRETHTFTYAVSPEYSATNMRWTYHTMKFKGTGPSTVVEFSSMVDGWYGPVIDDVKVFPIKGCSPQSAEQFPVTFVNNTKEKVSFHWLDFKCGEGGGPTVEAGASATGLTSPGHLLPRAWC